jgi:hypothetical protein
MPDAADILIQQLYLSNMMADAVNLCGKQLIRKPHKWYAIRATSAPLQYA